MLELRPTDAWDKGEASRWLLEVLAAGTTRAVPLFVGDDVTDEDALAVICGDGIGIVVRDEGDERTSAARYALDGPGEVSALLGRVRSFVER